MKTAVVLLNLGGPDRLDAVQPFLRNLFSDPAIVSAPALVRLVLAEVLSRRRARTARDNYARIGGGSPLLANTEAQARALEASLTSLGHGEARCFIAMRYWHPLSEETAEAVRAYDPEQVVLLPLYPQFSTTTTGSSLAMWRRAARAVGLTAPTAAVCCYPAERGFMEALARLARPKLMEALKVGRPRLLCSAHGLPKRVVSRGDPYQWQVERTAESVARTLGLDREDWVVCYQSRVGPLEWIGPETDEEIVRAGRDGVPVVVLPIAFVSEHLETLVELDMEYGDLARRHHVPGYFRVPTVQTAPLFIDGLARLVISAPRAVKQPASETGSRICDLDRTGCVCVGDGGC